mmetsp:Transcript_55480/g.168663  ORF Transcript_55480/g.168663 Transcript_55480/m.168663 type:complete len:250 (-) Transcript_55480:4652-5401(-)
MSWRFCFWVGSLIAVRTEPGFGHTSSAARAHSSTSSYDMLRSESVTTPVGPALGFSLGFVRFLALTWSGVAITPSLGDGGRSATKPNPVSGILPAAGSSLWTSHAPGPGGTSESLCFVLRANTSSLPTSAATYQPVADGSSLSLQKYTKMPSFLYTGLSCSKYSLCSGEESRAYAPSSAGFSFDPLALTSLGGCSSLSSMATSSPVFADFALDSFTRANPAKDSRVNGAAVSAPLMSQLPGPGGTSASL